MIGLLQRYGSYESSLKEKIIIPKQPLMVQHSQGYECFDYRAYGISHFYRFQVTPEMLETATIVPDGTVDIVFRCGQDHVDATCYGAVLKMHTIDYATSFHLDDTIFGIRFLPGKAFLPKGYPIGSLTETSIPLPEICKDQAMMEGITKSTDFKEQIQLFLNAYIPDYQNYYSPDTRPFSYCMVDEITKVVGIINVNELSQSVGYTPRYINRLFNNEIGLPPKTFSKIIRFQNVLLALGKDQHISTIAADMGYYDQSHLLKEFKQFTGISPLNYRKSLTAGTALRI
ncbi:helix-turn-helix domain-containing protein [Acetobacterium paludosum]|uniref:Helix-turn-helix domain-containing protein n=1 Tax=Acetobacterium paludosum TaxID=52693 RepID=A0A923KXP0_9FIRM|nr:helix-turn-helix domain-containing protein [Acetobacterium paludosum]MBC3888591.1 helix-turn-helix domain-containing protein [Acetobacterium paludosum]